MKTLTIGRGDGCNIILDDPAISRRHAILRISTLGKMEIVDISTNGTTVNNVKLRPNVPFPIKRKDRVLFAGVRKLDWKQVPNNSRYIKLAICGVISFVFLVSIFSITYTLYGHFFPTEAIDTENFEVLKKNDTETYKPEKKEDMDSIVKSIQKKERVRKQAEEAHRKHTEQKENAAKEKKSNPKNKKEDNSKPQHDNNSEKTHEHVPGFNI